MCGIFKWYLNFAEWNWLRRHLLWPGHTSIYNNNHLFASITRHHTWPIARASPFASASNRCQRRLYSRRIASSLSRMHACFWVRAAFAKMLFEFIFTAVRYATDVAVNKNSRTHRFKVGNWPKLGRHWPIFRDLTFASSFMQRIIWWVLGGYARDCIALNERLHEQVKTLNVQIGPTDLVANWVFILSACQPLFLRLLRPLLFAHRLQMAKQWYFGWRWIVGKMVANWPLTFELKLLKESCLVLWARELCCPVRIIISGILGSETSEEHSDMCLCVPVNYFARSLYKTYVPLICEQIRLVFGFLCVRWFMAWFFFHTFLVFNRMTFKVRAFGVNSSVFLFCFLLLKIFVFFLFVF